MAANNVVHKQFVTSSIVVLAIIAVIFLLLAIFNLGKQQGTTTQTQNTIQYASPAPTSTPATNSGLANPASVNCEKVGGKLVIKSNGAGEYGLCQFADNMACEEWALLRGQCPVGGVKTTGFDNIEQKYCAWSGGKTLAVKDATCTFSDGSVCDDVAFYNGTCQQGQK